MRDRSHAPRMFSEESLGKIKFRTFPKRVSSRKALITLEQVNTTDWSEKKKKKEEEES